MLGETQHSVLPQVQQRSINEKGAMNTQLYKFSKSIFQHKLIAALVLLTLLFAAIPDQTTTYAAGNTSAASTSTDHSVKFAITYKIRLPLIFK